jgi:hypothetical protein
MISDREPTIPIAGDLLGEAREVAHEALSRISATDDARMHYRALYAAERLGRAEPSRVGGWVRLVSREDLDVLADCAWRLIEAAPDEALLRKALRIVELGEPPRRSSDRR